MFPIILKTVRFPVLSHCFRFPSTRSITTNSLANPPSPVRNFPEKFTATMYLYCAGGLLLGVGAYKYLLQSSRFLEIAEGGISVINKDLVLLEHLGGTNVKRVSSVHKVGETLTSAAKKTGNTCTALQFWVEARNASTDMDNKNKTSNSKGIATVVSCDNFELSTPQVVCLDIKGKRSVVLSTGVDAALDVTPACCEEGKEDDTIATLEKRVIRESRLNSGTFGSLPIPYVIALGVVTSLVLSRMYLKLFQGSTTHVSTTKLLIDTAMRHVQSSTQCQRALGTPITLPRKNWISNLKMMSAEQNGRKGEIKGEYITNNTAKLKFYCDGPKGTGTVHFQAVKQIIDKHENWKFTFLSVEKDDLSHRPILIHKETEINSKNRKNRKNRKIRKIRKK